jgi:hypothetical protein
VAQSPCRAFAFVVDPICGYDVNHNVDLLSIAVFLLLLWRIVRCCLWLALVGDRLGQSMLQRNIAFETQVCLDRGDMCLLSRCCASCPVPTHESHSVSYLVVAPSPNVILRIAAVLTLDLPVPFDAFS